MPIPPAGFSQGLSPALQPAASRLLAGLTDQSLFEDCVSLFSGKVFFKLPLWQMSDLGGDPMAIYLSYESQAGGDTPGLGLGWNIPENSIILDGTTAVHRIVIDGSSYPLTKIPAASGSSGDVYHTQDSELAVVYRSASNDWAILGPGTMVHVYSAVSGVNNRWPLASITTAAGIILTYTYQAIGGKAFLAGLRRSDQQMALACTYGSGPFLLESVDLSAAGQGSARLAFTASTNTLTLSADGGAMLAFTYDSTASRLTTIHLPTGLVEFVYRKTDPLQCIDANRQYAISGGQPQVQYAAGYLVGSAIDAFEQLIIETLEPMTYEVRLSTRPGFPKRYPTLSLGESIDSYSVLPLADSMGILLTGEKTSRIFILDPQVAAGSDIFQPILGQWDVKGPGAIYALSGGVLFVGPTGCQFYAAQNSVWTARTLLTETTLPAVSTDGENVVFGDSTGFWTLSNLAADPPVKTAISGPTAAQFNNVASLAAKLTSTPSLQTQIGSVLVSRIISQAGQYLALSTPVFPPDLSTPLRTTSSLFQKNGAAGYTLVKTIDDAQSFTHQSLKDISAAIYPTDTVASQYTFRTQIYYSPTLGKYRLRLRNITILAPETYESTPFESIDWSTGVTYHLTQSIPLQDVVSGGSPPPVRVTYRLFRDGNGSPKQSYSIPDLAGFLSPVTFRIPQPGSDPIYLRNICFRGVTVEADTADEKGYATGQFDHVVATANANDDNSWIYQFAHQFIEGTQDVDEATFANLVETDGDLPDEVASYLGELLAEDMPVVDENGIVRAPGWVAGAASGSVPAKVAGTVVDNRFVYLAEDGQVNLYSYPYHPAASPDKASPLFTFPVASESEVYNFYPSCLAYVDQGATMLLQFHSPGAGLDPVPDTQAISCKPGMIDPGSSCPGSPYFTIATMVASQDGKTATVQIAPSAEIVTAFAGGDWVATSQTNTDGSGTATVTGYTYEMPWAMGREQLLYRSVAQLPANDAAAHGRIVKTLGDEQLVTKIFDGAGKMVDSSEQDTTASSAAPSAPATPSYPPDLLSSTLWNDTLHLPIAAVTLATFEGQEADFMSFESYETARLGPAVAGQPVWAVTGGTVQAGWPLTGRQYLALGASGQVTATYQPEDVEQIFSVGAWIRLAGEPGGVSPLSLAFENPPGTRVVRAAVVKDRWGEWTYHEAQLNVTMAFPAATTGTLTVSLAASGQPIDVDHLRMSPVGTDFQGQVFDAARRLPTSLVDGDGTCRTVLNAFDDTTLLQVDTHGQISSFALVWNPATQPLGAGSRMSLAASCRAVIRPAGGFYESMAPCAIAARWDFDPAAWKFAPGTATHGAGSATFSLKAGLVTSAWSIGCLVQGRDYTAATSLTVNLHGVPVTVTPPAGAAFDLAAVLIGDRLCVWINGQLIQDTRVALPSPAPVSAVTLELNGPATLGNLLVLQDPVFSLTYLNAQGKAFQTVTVLDAARVEISRLEYDALGRQSATVAPVVVGADASGALLSLRDPAGLPAAARETLAYGATPLALATAMERVGTEFAGHPARFFRGPWSDLSTTLPADLVQRLAVTLPDAFRQADVPMQATQDPNGNWTLIVMDANQAPIATFVDTPAGFIQNQFEYSDSGQLTCHRLPRQFRLEVGGDTGPTATLGHERTLAYTDDGQISLVTDPDSGCDVLVHDNETRLQRFQVHYDTGSRFAYLLITDYDTAGHVNGVLHHPNPQLTDAGGQPVNWNDRDAVASILGGLASVATVPDAIQSLIDDATELSSAQVASYSPVPGQRGQLQLATTSRLAGGDGTLPAIEATRELFQWDLRGLPLVKQVFIDGDDVQTAYDYTPGGQVSSITYPAAADGTSIQVVYERDLLGRVTTVRSADGTRIFAQYTYVGANSTVATETLPGIGATRQYTYNPSSQLAGIADEYLSEALTYTGQAYSETPYYNGVIASAAFESPWTRLVNDTTALQNLRQNLVAELPGQAAAVDTLLQALGDQGYLDLHGFLTQPIHLESVYDLPSGVVDLARSLLWIERQPSVLRSGHQYAYESAGQLTKAKFGVGGDLAAPMRFGPAAIQGLLGLDASAAGALHQRFLAGGHVNSDGLWFLQLDDGLAAKLAADASPGAAYLKAHPISLRNLLVDHYASGQPLSGGVFGGYYLMWLGTPITDPAALARMGEATQAWNWLVAQGFIDANQHVTDQLLSPGLHQVAADSGLTARLPDLTRLVQTSRRLQIGTSACDANAFEIDANGNVAKYFVGQARYQLQIADASNRLEALRRDDLDGVSPTASFAHDANGNLSAAPHRSITGITYDPVTNRPAALALQDGRIVQLAYDYRGARVLKRISDAQGTLVEETRYLRDEAGRVLFEWHTTPTDSWEVQLVYGPSGLVSFLRDGVCYHVIKDHEGSVRVIVDEQKNVVAAFHYLPYGQVSQSYGNLDLLRYRYLGQEYDPETGLYNLNARLYDPDLGRFFQADPAKQYASPYVYAGNSPVSYSDPSGLFSWNGSLPDFSRASTWQSMDSSILHGLTRFGNAIGGGAISIAELGLGASVDILSSGALAEGIGGALIGAGIGGLTYTIQSGDNFSWGEFGREEWIGAAVGALTAGMGAIEGALVEDAAVGYAEGSGEQFAAKTVTRLLSRSTSGTLGSMTQTVLENAASGNSWDDGIGRAAWVGAMTGAFSAGVGAGAEKSLERLGIGAEQLEGSAFSRGSRAVLLGSATGFAGTVTGTLVTNAIQGQPLDSGLWQSAIGDIMGGVTTAGHVYNPDRPPLISRGLQRIAIESEGNCLAASILEGARRQGIATPGLSDAADLRQQSAARMRQLLQSDPATFQAGFAEMLAKAALNPSRAGLSPALNAVCDEIVMDYLTGPDRAGDEVSVAEIARSYAQDDQLIQDYISDVAGSKVWGNLFELGFMADALGVKFKLRMPGADGQETWHQIGNKNAADSVYLRFGDQHYDLFVKSGLAFFSPRRAYVALGDDAGFGGGKEASKFLRSLTDADLSGNDICRRCVSRFKKGGKLTDAMKEIFRAPGARRYLLDLVNKMVNVGGLYGSLRSESLSSMIESNHMPPKSVVPDLLWANGKKIGNLAQGKMPSVNMEYEDHRIFPTTGNGPLNAQAKAALEKLPGCAKLTTMEQYRAYLSGRKTYAGAMAVEIQVKRLMFKTKYKTGIDQAIDAAFNGGFIDEDQAQNLQLINA